jgi:LAO/AO transport system kinase
MRDDVLADLVNRAVAGQQQAIARLLSTTERSLADASKVLESVAALPRNGVAIGVAGSPGVGKSSLIAAMVSVMLEQDKRVAVLANDPTGFYTGGALLGDRVRMNNLECDARDFIRSVAARDPMRSLSVATYASVDLLSRIGYDYVVIETVGTGQSDLATRHVADTTVPVLAPGCGDDVQAMKSGVMEMADIFVLNKCELPSSRETLQMLRKSIEHLLGREEWTTPVVPVSAAEATGIHELLERIAEHDARPSSAPKESTGEVIIDLVTYEVTRRLREYLPGSPNLARQIGKVALKHTNVLTASLQLAGDVLA